MVNGHGILALPKDACNHVIGQGNNGGKIQEKYHPSYKREGSSNENSEEGGQLEQ